MDQAELAWRRLFDNPPQRKGSNCFKWDFNDKKYGRHDLIPLWIADMDFEIAQPIQDALLERIQHPVFGYHFRSKEYVQSIQDWLSQRYQWHVDEANLLFYPPGTVAAINMLVNLFTEIGDEIIVQTPSYPPLMNIVKQNKRVLVENNLQRVEGQFQVDFDALEKSITSKTKALIFCSPHNPTGRVWSEEDLKRLADLCRSRGIMVISDEVHADIVAKGHQHFHFNKLDESIRPSSVTIISSCKSFNLAGLSQSTLICDDPSLKRKIQWAINTSQLNLDNVMSATATTAAYSLACHWLEQMNSYVQNNRELLGEVIAKELPQVLLAKAQGTYLAWLDFGQLDYSHDELRQLFVEKAGVGLYDGMLFGDCGDGFFRINLACSRQLLEQASKQIIDALKS